MLYEQSSSFDGLLRRQKASVGFFPRRECRLRANLQFKIPQTRPGGDGSIQIARYSNRFQPPSGDVLYRPQSQTCAYGQASQGISLVFISLLRLWEGGFPHHPGAQLSKLGKYGRVAAEELFENDSSYPGKRLEGETPLLFRSLHRQSRLGGWAHGAVEDLPEPAKEKLDDKVQGEIRAIALSRPASIG